jgi:hypothetical protein
MESWVWYVGRASVRQAFVLVDTTWVTWYEGHVGWKGNLLITWDGALAQRMVLMVVQQ